MNPTFCGFHKHWTDGPCESGKGSLNRQQLLMRIIEIDTLLGDDEVLQSNGYHVNQALRVERTHLEAVRAVLS